MKYDTWPSLQNPYAPSKTENVKSNEGSGYESPGYAVNKPGYPTDDALALQQMAGYGTANLDIWYDNSFVQNETHTHQGGASNLSFVVEHTPVLAGTMTGTIYRGEVAIQTFVISQAGAATLTSIGNPGHRVLGVALNPATGVLNFQWNSPDPGENKIVINYEYNLEQQYGASQYETAASTGKMTATASTSWQKPKSMWSKLEDGEIDASESVVGHVVNDEIAELQRQLAEARNELTVTKRVLENLETELYNEYEGKVKQVKEFMVTKVDEFLTHKSKTMEGAQECAKMGGKQIVEEAVRYNAAMDEAKELRQEWEQKN